MDPGGGGLGAVSAGLRFSLDLPEPGGLHSRSRPLFFPRSTVVPPGQRRIIGHLLAADVGVLYPPRRLRAGLLRRHIRLHATHSTPLRLARQQSPSHQSAGSRPGRLHAAHRVGRLPGVLLHSAHLLVPDSRRPALVPAGQILFPVAGVCSERPQPHHLRTDHAAVPWGVCAHLLMDVAPVSGDIYQVFGKKAKNTVLKVLDTRKTSQMSFMQNSWF